MVNWDWLISAGILIVLALSIWAKVSKQTIPELIGNIVDRVRGTSEDTIDYATEIYD